jgi:formyl-CoA transferase
MPGPYAGIRVIELGRFIAVPYCGQLLADGGADVIKIEPLSGDDARRNGTRLGDTEARQFLNKNRGKRSAAVKISDPRVQAIIRKLAGSADVIISNFRPGQAAELGIDDKTLRATNSRLIYAENSAFGPRGPLSRQPGMDLLLQGLTGLAPIHDGSPVPFGDPIIDYTAAMLMAWGIATALFHRERTGKGQSLDVSLLQAALVIQNNSINHVDAADGWRDDFVSYLKDAFSRGATLGDVIAHRDTLKPAIEPPYYGFFPTRDGMIALAAGGRALQQRAAKALGVGDPALEDDSYQPADIAAHARAMRAESAAAFRKKTTEHWLGLFAQAGVPAGTIHLKDEILDHPQAWENEYLVRLEHETLGGMTVVAPPVKFSDSPLAITTASPVLGRHTAEILTEAGLTHGEIDALAGDGVARIAP